MDLVFNVGFLRGWFQNWKAVVSIRKFIYTSLHRRSVHSINDVVMLDRQLTRFFWFIAAIGIAGAIATLAASLYASAERKSYELSVLRLLGFTRFEIMQFPAWQALVLTVFGFALSLAVYVTAATVLQSVFREQLNPGERLMLLPSAPVALIFSAIAVLAIFSSFLASHRLLKSDLSESLREGAG